jgi:hypothetical protein
MEESRLDLTFSRSVGLLTGGLLVRVQPGESGKPRKPGAFVCSEGDQAVSSFSVSSFQSGSSSGRSANRLGCGKASSCHFGGPRANALPTSGAFGTLAVRRYGAAANIRH